LVCLGKNIYKKENNLEGTEKTSLCFFLFQNQFFPCFSVSTSRKKKKKSLYNHETFKLSYLEKEKSFEETKKMKNIKQKSVGIKNKKKQTKMKVVCWNKRIIIC
jgi:hypothetical protein